MPGAGGGSAADRPKRERLDRLLVERGLARSRERAQAMVMSGVVRVDGRPATKAGTLVPGDARVTVVAPDHPFVGRGGVKLDGALAALGVDPAGRTALDVGASTGGFTDCLLRRGARRVYALDVGHGQIDWGLRNDPRVVVLEKVNARYLAPEDLPETVSLAVVDVSFISLRLVLPPLLPFLEPGADVLALVKPQFEVGKGETGKGGIVRDPARHLEVLETVSRAAGVAGLALRGGCPSPITGAEGNQEFFLHFVPGVPTDPATRAGLLGGIVHGAQGTPGKD